MSRIKSFKEIMESLTLRKSSLAVPWNKFADLKIGKSQYGYWVNVKENIAIPVGFQRHVEAGKKYLKACLRPYPAWLKGEEDAWTYRVMMSLGWTRVGCTDDTLWINGSKKGCQAVVYPLLEKYPKYFHQVIIDVEEIGPMVPDGPPTRTRFDSYEYVIPKNLDKLFHDF